MDAFIIFLVLILPSLTFIGGLVVGFCIGSSHESNSDL